MLWTVKEVADGIFFTYISFFAACSAHAALLYYLHAYHYAGKAFSWRYNHESHWYSPSVEEIPHFCPATVKSGGLCQVRRFCNRSDTVGHKFVLMFVLMFYPVFSHHAFSSFQTLLSQLLLIPPTFRSKAFTICVFVIVLANTAVCNFLSLICNFIQFATLEKFLHY